MKVIAPDHEIKVEKTSSANGAKKAKRVARRGKIKEFVSSGKASDTLDKARGILDIFRGGSQDTTTDTEDQPKEGLSTGAMIGIGVGAVVIIGLIMYSSKKK